MRNWWIVFVVAVVVLGCGGGSGGGGGGVGATSGGANLVPAPTVALTTNYAGLQWTVVTGAGRRSPGELIAQIRPIDVRNGDFDVAGTPKQIGATLNS